MEIRLVNRETVAELEKEIDAFLLVLGIDGALYTDESRVEHFVDVLGDAEHELQELLRDGGLHDCGITLKDTLPQAVRKIWAHHVRQI